MKTQYHKTVSLFNGNNKRYTLTVPQLYFMGCFAETNITAQKHFERNTGLKLHKIVGGFRAYPKTFKQITKVLMTYDYTTQFYNNASFNNTIFFYPTSKQF